MFRLLTGIFSMEDTKRVLLSKNTWIPVGLLSIIITGVWFLAITWFQVQQNRESMAENRIRITTLEKQNNDLVLRLTIIETKLDSIMEALKIKQ